MNNKLFRDVKVLSVNLVKESPSMLNKAVKTINWYMLITSEYNIVELNIKVSPQVVKKWEEDGKPEIISMLFDITTNEPVYESTFGKGYACVIIPPQNSEPTIDNSLIAIEILQTISKILISRDMFYWAGRIDFAIALIRKDKQ